MLEVITQKLNLASLKNKPKLVCVPGLLGGSEDFARIVAPLVEHFEIHYFDPNAGRRDVGLSGLTIEMMKEIEFNFAASDMAAMIQKCSDEPVYLCGISLGGKIVFDFVHQYPELVHAAIVTDVGPGSFTHSELFQFVDQNVTQLNLNQEWKDLKSDLQGRISDRNLRLLIQSQIYYPEQGKLPAAWRVGMANFGALLERQSLDDQFLALEKKDNLLSSQNKFIHILKAEYLSAIDEPSFEKMKHMGCLKIHPIANSTHFLHISHKDDVHQIILKSHLDRLALEEAKESLVHSLSAADLTSPALSLNG
jgi:pimeloyl-ACP methyl ester carboxylesterase